jgi:triosephosphate isomerase
VKNAQELTSEEDIDGVLVGGASLDPKNLAEIAIQCGKEKAPKKRKPKTKEPE